MIGRRLAGERRLTQRDREFVRGFSFLCCSSSGKQHFAMRRCYRFWILWCFVVLTAGVARADNFALTDGQTFTGDLVAPDDKGAMIRTEDGKYVEIAQPDGKLTQRIPWSRFSQDDLKRIMANNRRAAAFAEPWIDVVPVERAKAKEFTVKEVGRLPHPPAGSFIGGFASSGIGLTILFLLYLANLYAAYEISTVRAYPWAMVCGVSAVAPLIGPIIFLCLPTRMKTREQEEAETYAAELAAQQAMALQTAEQAAPPPESGLGLAARASAQAKPELPPTQVFTRGQFTFNRRFFETKFSNYFGMVRREADKEMLLIFRTARAQLSVERISRIAANDLHLQVRRGSATEEVQVPFIEIQEVVLKHKDAP